MIRPALTFGGALVSAALASSAEAACRLALILAMDVSSSVSDEEYRLQQTGLAAALMSEDVLSAILDTREGYVSLAVYEWSGRNQQNLILDWIELTDRAAVAAAASTILQNTRSYSKFPTSMGFSLGYGVGLYKSAPRCDRRVIDVSGDGVNNDGFGPQIAYRHFPFENVTVNGLVIKGSDPEVELFYERDVLKGRFAFLEVAQGFDDFERVMTRKLFREISNLMVGDASQLIGDLKL
ncbi:DUF1194 domain-containing protein [Planktotalea sp.]|uniref:DUF1194 domain-containing protein n=1 Tax=Planktotalea sp. TaxID=2029877 RepID=UPI003F6C8C54